jgi:hypothetical protein
MFCVWVCELAGLFWNECFNVEFFVRITITKEHCCCIDIDLLRVTTRTASLRRGTQEHFRIVPLP